MSEQKWQLVPIEPTEEMIYWIATAAHRGDSGSGIWSEALDYAPEADWPKRALEVGLQYVRESDDHYVTATPEQMADLLREFVGIDVRRPNGCGYNEAVPQPPAHELLASLERFESDGEDFVKLHDVHDVVAMIKQPPAHHAAPVATVNVERPGNIEWLAEPTPDDGAMLYAEPQPTALGDDLDDALRDMASSACQMALNDGINEDAFLRLARSVRQRIEAIKQPALGGESEAFTQLRELVIGPEPCADVEDAHDEFLDDHQQEALWLLRNAGSISAHASQLQAEVERLTESEFGQEQVIEDLNNQVQGAQARTAALEGLLARIMGKRDSCLSSYWFEEIEAALAEDGSEKS